MKKVIVEMPDELYERAIKLAENLGITFDELCCLAITEYLDKRDEKIVKNDG